MSLMLTHDQTACVGRLAEYGHFASEHEALDASPRIGAEHLVARHLQELAAEGKRSGDPVESSPNPLEEIQRLSVQDFERGVAITDAVTP